MRRSILNLFIFMGLLLGLPLLGVFLAGYPMGAYLEFPPQTRYVEHAPFSWLAFSLYSLFIGAIVDPVIWWARTAAGRSAAFGKVREPRGSFPWWGWLGVAAGWLAWGIAWSRLAWFEPYQPHTFTPLWLSFIVVVNGLTYRRQGYCLLTGRTRFFLCLFPLSAVFWWLFEYLNRFVQNWYYTGVHYGPWSYFLLATPPFSTVLPAVLSVREWLLSYPALDRTLSAMPAVKLRRPGFWTWGAFLVSSIGLLGIGVYPNHLFSLLWIAPTLLLIALRSLAGKSHVLQGVEHGDWRLVVSSALAALVCGVFWEMWNFYSLARWEYAIPFVHRFLIFEMPLLGYAGYLPFGLQCALAAELLDSP